MDHMSTSSEKSTVTPPQQHEDESSSTPKSPPSFEELSSVEKRRDEKICELYHLMEQRGLLSSRISSLSEQLHELDGTVVKLGGKKCDTKLIRRMEDLNVDAESQHSPDSMIGKKRRPEPIVEERMSIDEKSQSKYPSDVAQQKIPKEKPILKRKKVERQESVSSSKLQLNPSDDETLSSGSDGSDIMSKSFSPSSTSKNSRMALSISSAARSKSLDTTSRLHYWGGTLRMVPEDFTLPKGGVQHAWENWMIGDGSGSPAIRMLKSADVKHLSRGRKGLSDLKYLMGRIESDAKGRGLWKEFPTPENVKEMYIAAIPVLGNKIGGGELLRNKKNSRDLSWQTVVSILRCKKREERRHIKKPEVEKEIEDDSISKTDVKSEIRRENPDDHPNPLLT